MEKKYNIYISAFSGKSLQDAVSTLAKNFNIQLDDARKILENVPVLFMSNLNRKEVRTLKGKLISVSKQGVEFTISAQEVPYLAKVNYKGDGKQIASIESNWYSLAFSCPHCKNLILLKPALQEGVAEQTKPKVGSKLEVSKKKKEPIIEPVEEYPSVVEEELQPQEMEQEQHSEQLTDVSVETQTEEEVPQEQMVDEVPVEQSAVEEVPVDTGAEVTQQDVIEIKEEMEEPEVVQESEEQVSEEPQVQETEQQEPVMIEEQPAIVEDQAPVILEEEQPAATKQEVFQTHTGIPDDYTGHRYRVFVSNITGDERKEQAAQLLSELTGVSYEEAIEKFKKLIVLVFQEATEEQANNAVAKFKELKIRATKTRIKS